MSTDLKHMTPDALANVLLPGVTKMIADEIEKLMVSYREDLVARADIIVRNTLGTVAQQVADRVHLIVQSDRSFAADMRPIIHLDLRIGNTGPTRYGPETT